MKSARAGLMASLALGGLLVASLLHGTGCDDDDATTGAAGTGGGAGTIGSAGSTGSAGTTGNGGGGGATVNAYALTLTGGSEVPPVNTQATASVAIMLDASDNVTVTGTFTGLTADVTVAHIHGPASATMTADPIVDLTVSPGRAGTVSGSGQLTASEASAMRSGMTYINIHSSANTAGEIRAQIQ